MARVYRWLIKLIYLSGIFVIHFSCYHEQEIPVIINFDYQIPEGGYTVPVRIALTNRTTGADFYSWTFEGASPASSDKKQPGPITYAQAGSYTIRLEAWNDTQRTSREITVQLDSAVTIDFDPIVLVNDFVPATVDIRNKTKGASTYEWTFEGGTPDKSTLVDPPQIQYHTPGKHIISLKVTNGRETFTTSKALMLKAAMQAGFEIIPSIDDQDYEAPLAAKLQNQTSNGLRYTWSSTGGNITDTKAANTEIYFDSPGNYTVSLVADNDKEVQTVTHTIRVKPNTNLYIQENVKLGVTAAHASIGSFYAPMLRDVLTQDEVGDDNGQLIDLVFFGINSSFAYCRFISPDSADKFSFPPIPRASHTYFVNTLETTSISFTSSDFDAMTNDSALATIDIKANDTGISFFNSNQPARIVLFQTQDGRKGAIKIKAFVAAGLQSYILADVKVQKTK